MTSDSALESLLDRRFGCRAFLPDPVPRPVIERVLQLAQRTATWCNTRPWHLHITERLSIERLRVAFYEHAKSGAAGGADPQTCVTWVTE